MGKPQSFIHSYDLLPVHINFGYEEDGFFCVILIFKSFKFFNRFLLIFFSDLIFNKIDLFGHLFLKEKAISIAKGTVVGSANGMGAATKGGSFKWVGSKDSKW